MIIFILAGIIFLIGSLVYVKNKNNLQEIRTIDKNNVKRMKRNLSNLWGIDEISNQVVSINKNQHSIIIELESIEYCLLHDEEKRKVDAELKEIASTLEFPIQFLEIKQKINMEESIENIKIHTINSNNYIKEYANNIINHLKTFEENEDLFERRCYLIVSSFNKKSVAENELKKFYQTIRYGMTNIKIGTRLLTDIEIIELIYEQLHKGNPNRVRNIQEQGGLELYVTKKK
jgi:hypothetical protein